ncbi:MAG: 1,4-dihydroxy-2-naphthoate polyprenyltransferase [Cytophagales bacterium]|nr:1,4-dihydroxy-2-naphthoate polyprenyltransferase [Cytophagales bacterium]
MVGAWIKAMRLRTLPLAWASITMGGSLAALNSEWDWGIYFLSLLTAFALQIASNFANDYGDSSSGIDGENREGPSRTIQSGLVTSSQMKKAIILVTVVAFALGLWLIFYTFIDWVVSLSFILIGVVSIAAALKYTMGKNPYGYAGFGDIFVLVFFGWVGVGGSYFLHTQFLDLMVMLPASALGLLAVAVLNVNNIRDINSDKASGKFSIPVRIGRKNAVIYHAAILLSSMILLVLFGWLSDFKLSQWLFLLATPLFVKNWLGVKREQESMKLDPYLKQMALTTLLVVVLFVVGNLI